MVPDHSDSPNAPAQGPQNPHVVTDNSGNPEATNVGNEFGARTVVGGESAESPKSTAGIVVKPGDRIGKYLIRARLGEGAMGVVYQAFDTLIERDVAIKVLSRDVAGSDVILQRFLAEARAIGKLNHPNVVSIYDVDLWERQYYLVMELLSGGSLAQVIESRRSLPWPEACRLVAQAAQGLAAAHSAGMIHRDVKPENLMLSKEGVVKVVDFGLSKVLDAASEARNAMSRAGQILGTPHYMSPEQFDAREVDARTDIYSLGGTLYRLLTGRFPFQDSPSLVQVMTAHLTKPAPLATDYVPGIPEQCDRIIARAMAKQVGDRYPNVAEMAEELWDLSRRQQQVSIDDGPRESAGKSRPLQTAVIVEPSKMHAAILNDALARASVGKIAIFQTSDAARRAVESNPPDLLVTAMQLPDGRGIDLVSSLANRSCLNQSTIVLISSDLNVEDLVSAGAAASLVLAPRKARPDEILRVVHAGGPSMITGRSFSAPIGPTDVRIQVILDSDRIPPSLADAIRSLGLLDVSIFEGSSAQGPVGVGVPTLRLELRTAGSAAGDSILYAKRVAAPSPDASLVAAVQVDGNCLVLRAIGRHGVISVHRRRFDAERLTCLLQACRP